MDILGGTVPETTPTLIRALLKTGLGANIHTLGKAQEPEAAELDELRASLRYLEALPVDALERQLRGCIDLFAYRLDAWITSLATRRLGELRAKAPRALVLGAFGWVQGLKASPRATVPAPPGETGEHFAAREPGGFLHAPSLAQASAAAVLRSGYLAHMGEAGSGQLAINLSSSRVRVAESLLDGVRQGQQLGSLLGYRFERGLHERQLDRFIAGFRRISLLGRVYQAQQDLDLLLGGFGFPPPKQVKAAEEALKAELDAVRNRLGDGAERDDRPSSSRSRRRASPTGSRSCGSSTAAASGSTGSASRSAATARSSRPSWPRSTRPSTRSATRSRPRASSSSCAATRRGPRRASTRSRTARSSRRSSTSRETPRPGTALTHRLVALFSGPAPTPAAGVRAARRAAEPKLDAWLAQMVGAPKNVRLRAEFVDDAGEVVGATDVRLSVLGVTSLDAFYLSASAAPELPSDLERLLEHVLLRSAPASVPPTARVRLDRSRGAGFGPADLSLTEFGELNAAFRQAVLSARTLDSRDFHEDARRNRVCGRRRGARQAGRPRCRDAEGSPGRARRANRSRRRRSTPRRARRPRLPRHPRGGPGLGARGRRHASFAGTHDRGGGDPSPCSGRRARGRLRREGRDAGPAREARAGAARSRLRARLQGAAARPAEGRGRARHRLRPLRQAPRRRAAPGALVASGREPRPPRCIAALGRADVRGRASSHLRPRAEGRPAPVRRRRALGRAAGEERRPAGVAAGQALARRAPAAGVRRRRSRSPGSCSTSGSSSSRRAR